MRRYVTTEKIEVLKTLACSFSYAFSLIYLRKRCICIIGTTTRNNIFLFNLFSYYNRLSTPDNEYQFLVKIYIN